MASCHRPAPHPDAARRLFAAPGVRLGTIFEVYIAPFSDEYAETDRGAELTSSEEPGGVGVATEAPPKPSLTMQPRLPNQDEYEIRVYDERKGRRLVAAIELISPSNKDRAETRGAFVSKVATLLRQGVCVSLVDVVTSRQFNLYAELLGLLDGTDAMLGAEPPAPVRRHGATPSGKAQTAAGCVVLPAPDRCDHALLARVAQCEAVGHAESRNDL